MWPTEHADSLYIIEFAGTLCEQDVVTDMCRNHRCQNNARCINEGTGYRYDMLCLKQHHVAGRFSLFCSYYVHVLVKFPCKLTSFYVVCKQMRVRSRFFWRVLYGSRHLFNPTLHYRSDLSQSAQWDLQYRVHLPVPTTGNIVVYVPIFIVGQGTQGFPVC